MTSAGRALRTLYPSLEPYDAGLLPVGDGQRIHWETSGNPDGRPVVFVHGGPGGATGPDQRRYFDPDAYRIVLFDQRGCGQSVPHVADGADLSVNTTPHSIADMEALRQHLAIESWSVFGGSWGSTLSLAYAQAHPDRVTSLVLRGIFLLRPQEIDWYYRGGAGHLFPERWEEFLAPIPVDERNDDPVEVYHRLLHSSDPEVATRAAVAWSTWEGATSSLIPKEDKVAENAEPRFALAFSRIENHYFRHGGFLGRDQLLRNVPTIAHVPSVIVQGRYDVVCPPVSARDLHRAWPGSTLEMVPDAGHSASEPGIVDRLVRATDSFR